MRGPLLGDGRFRAFLAGMLSSGLAVQIQSVAVGWHVFSLRHRPLDLGLVGLVLFLPTFTLWVAAGVFVDRHDRRWIAASGAFVEALCSLAFAALVLAHDRRLGFYLAVLLIVGVVRAFTSPAERALLPSLIEPQRYLKAQAAYSSLRELAVIAGPALGGLLIALSTAVAFAGSALLFAVGGVALALLRTRREVALAAATVRRSLDGVRYILARPVIAGAISLDLFAVFFGGVTALLPIFADQILRAGPIGLGALRSAPALGAAAVAVLLAHHPPQRHIGRMLLLTVTGFGLATILFALSRNIWLSLALLFIVGGTDMVSVMIRNGLVQLGTPAQLRGRVNALENVFIGASNELGEFESGTLAAFIGTVPSVFIGGVVTLIVVVLWSLLFPALRKADSIPLAECSSRSVHPE
ncbi:MAG: MFS transporter [Candidatus Eremiobacteraeota bacterium]|nr:MFS transporter [Candidatus Eremiobacteraeota bacterium]